MWEKTLIQRFVIIIAVVLVALFLLYPPKEKLRGGLDIEGGVSMIFEIQEEPGENDPHLADRMKQLLQRRVDPKGVYGLSWRVLGRNRLEIQMPLPPEENKQLRADYIAAREQLLSTNIKRSELETALRMSGDARTTRLVELARGDTPRQERLEQATQAYDAYKAAVDAFQAAQAQAQGGAASEPSAESQPAASAPAGLRELRLAQRDAEEALDDALDAVLATNFNERRFQEVLDMEPGTPRRESSLKDLYAHYSLLKGQIVDVVKRYDAWRARHAFLEGPADLRRLLRGAGVLEFRILAEPSPDNVTKYDQYRDELHERGPRPQEGDRYEWFPIDNPMAFFNLNTPDELRNFEPRSTQLFVADKREDTWYILAKRGESDGLLHSPQGTGRPWRLKRAYARRDSSGRPAVAFELDPIGGELFGKLTANNIDKQLCIFVDDVAYSSARIQSRITTSGIITGEFSREKINYLVQTLEAGSLPARLKDTPLSERTIGSSLGHTNLRQAFRAGVLGLIAVMALMIVYYLICGAIANVALCMNLILVLAAMAMLGARFTLAGIAGVILTIGMSVDANVLIFERMREERARGSSLRMVIKNGYDKALSTIIDANITTLLICVIIYYVGSEEIKGFGLTLGWGIVTSLFTALFVTRAIFTLLVKRNWIKDVKMLQLIGVPNIDWYAKRKFFIPMSLILMALGLALLWDRGKKDTLDVEFLGGVSAEVALRPEAAGKYDDVRIRDALGKVGEQIATDGRQLAEARVTPVPEMLQSFYLDVPDVPFGRLAAMVGEPLESLNLLQRNGVDTSAGENRLILRARENVSAEALQTAIRQLAGNAEFSVVQAGGNIAHANIGAVTESAAPQERGRLWDITTTETNKTLVQNALVAAFGDDLDVQPRISYVFQGQDNRPYPVTYRRLEENIPDLPPGAGGDLTDYLGGVAMYFRQMTPAQSVGAITERLRSMRLQPDYQNMPWRNFQVFGVRRATAAEGQPAVGPHGEPLYSSMVIAVGDPRISYDEDREAWLQDLAQPELGLAMATLDKEQSLRKITQFKPQIAGQSQDRALLSLLLAWAMIICYMWIRFGRPRYGIAGVVALVHDVCIALAFVGISGWIGGANHPIGNALLISDFKIDMTIVAAFLTIIGYSINDTIVVFDRIRETRGRLGVVTPQIINQSINQTLARTLLTSGTTLIVILAMYIFGGTSIRGFNFCMLIGILTGTYSSIAVASPLLMIGLGKRRATAEARRTAGALETASGPATTR